MSKSFSQMIKAVKHKSRLSNIDSAKNRMVKVPNVFHSFDMNGNNEINFTLDRSNNNITLNSSQYTKKPDINSSFAQKSLKATKPKLNPNLKLKKSSRGLDPSPKDKNVKSQQSLTLNQYNLTQVNNTSGTATFDAYQTSELNQNSLYNVSSQLITSKKSIQKPSFTGTAPQLTINK